jgi:hypothetical protein
VEPRFSVLCVSAPPQFKKHIFAKRTHFEKFPKSMQTNKKHKNSASFWRKNEPIFYWCLGVFNLACVKVNLSQIQVILGDLSLFQEKKLFIF